MNGLGSSIILEDSTAALALANDGKKYRPCTKHLSIKWYHFRDQVKKGWLNVQKVDTKENWADIFTKPLPKPQFCVLCDELMGGSAPRKRSRQSIIGIPAHAVPKHAAAAFAWTPHHNCRCPRKRPKQ
jgi:hypothetical protein